MNILHILSPNVLTGSEYYTHTLCEAFDRLGHKNYILADKLHLPIKGRLFECPISNRSFWQVQKNKRILKKVVNEVNPDIVHCHSRAGYKLAHSVLKNSRIPVVTTMHGRQHIHFSSKNFDVTGDSIIAVCENIQTHLVDELNVNPKKINVIHNCINFSDIKTEKTASKNKIISFIGRTNSIKGDRLSQIIENCAKNILEFEDDLIIRIIGGPISNLSAKANEIIKDLNSCYNNRIENYEHVNNLPDYIAESTVVIAAGRCAIEALYLSKHVIAAGESACIGLLNENNFSDGVNSNFGDISSGKNNTPFDSHSICKEIFTALNTSQNCNFRDRLISIYSNDLIIERILQVYYSAKIKKVYPKYIPTLTYHQVTVGEPDTKHKIYVSTTLMEKQIKLLKLLNFTPITFKEYFAFRTGEISTKYFPKRPIILTFDDGYEDNYKNLFPLLKKYKIKAVVFILGDRNIRENVWDTRNGELPFSLLSKDQILEMQAYGIEFGAHTFNHSKLTELNDEELDYQIKDCKTSLENELNTKIVSFCYPYGAKNEHIKTLVKKAGYDFGISTDSGGLDFEQDLFDIFRVQIFNFQGLLTFLKKALPTYRYRYFKKRGK